MVSDSLREGSMIARIEGVVGRERTLPGRRGMGGICRRKSSQAQTRKSDVGRAE